MCKQKIFSILIEKVSEVTDIKQEDILSNSKDMETVDARSILVYLLYEAGFYPKRIASLLGKTAASIRYLHLHFEQRKYANKMIEKYVNNIRKQLANN